MSTKQASHTPVGYYGQMQVKGNAVTGSKTGKPMQVMGMSFFWSNWSRKYYTADYVDIMVDEFNCEIIRLPYGIRNDGVPFETGDVALLETVVEQAIKRGIYVILDWHSHGAHNNPEEAISFFSAMAEKYGSYDNVIFELYNEPLHANWEQIKTYAELVIPAIRKHSDNLIIVGTPKWSQDVLDAANFPIEDANVAYALHFYAGTHKKKLRDGADRAMEKGIAIFVSEWGSVNADGNGGISKISTTKWLKWMDENHLSGCTWAVNDKDESSSIFSHDSEINDTGKYIKKIISDRTLKAPWRKDSK